MDFHFEDGVKYYYYEQEDGIAIIVGYNKNQSMGTLQVRPLVNQENIYEEPIVPEVVEESVPEAVEESVSDDVKALYGRPLGSSGSSLNMAGWVWDEIPQPYDTSDEEGKIVFEITIDERGYIISIKTISTTVSLATEKIYRAEVENLTFSKTDNNPSAPRSTGRITFIIKAR